MTNEDLLNNLGWGEVHRAKVNYRILSDEAKDWLETQIGERALGWEFMLIERDNVMLFKSAKDAMMFKLMFG